MLDFGHVPSIKGRLEKRNYNKGSKNNMGIWETFKSWLFTGRRRKYKITHPDLYVLDVDALAKELALDEDAKRLGLAGIPSAEAVDLCGTEAKIVQRINKARLDYVDWATVRLQNLKQRLAKRDVSQLVNRALQADKEFERNANTLLAGSDSLIRKLASKDKKAQEELEEFRAQHGLRREPRYPSGAASFFRYSLLFFLILVEGVTNAWFYAQGMSGGLLDGFVAAAVFAGINLVSAFVFGKYCVPYVNHRSPFLKSLGVLLTLLALTLMLCISLGIAHYRDALVLEAEEPAKFAWEAYKANIFGLNDLFSWLLFGVSVAFALVALFDGRSSDDPYPGYGKVARHARNARDEYHDEVERIREELDSKKQDEIENLDNGITQAQLLLAENAALIEDKRSAESRLHTALSDAKHCANALLRMFRDANAIHRNAIPIPAYFHQSPDLHDPELPDFGIEADVVEHQEQQKLVNELLGSVDTKRANIQAAFNRVYDHLTPLDAHLADKGAN